MCTFAYQVIDALAFSSPEAVFILVSTKISRPLAGSDFLGMHRDLVSYSQAISFVRHDSEHGQSDETSVNCELPVLNLPREVAIHSADQN